MTQKDAEELNRVLATYADELEGIVRKYVDEPSERDDVRQEIAIALWRALPRYRGDASERTYVRRIAHNRVITFCLRRARERVRFNPLTDDISVSAPDTGEHDIERLQLRVSSLLSKLSPTQRHVLALAAEGLSSAQISQCTGRNPGAVRVALHRTRQLLQRWLRTTETPNS